METALKMYLYLMLLVFICDGFHVHGPPDPLIVQLGDSVMLPCFVETPLPLEDLEVEWKRNDSETLVHLWQNGESRPESQNHLYHDRAQFFTKGIAHGNFSLLLTDVTSKDAGVYKCTVYTTLDSGETLIEIKDIERLIVSGAHVISAYAGEDITLNCSVDSHLPPENIEEVSWKKIDEDILVLLYQEGQILTESTGERYVDRVEFFSAEERNKGNFSMRLKNVRTEDKGLYMCLVFSGELSANTTVEIQQLGFSSMHIGIVLLCILGFGIGSLILGYLSYTCYKKKDSKITMQHVQWVHLICPNITMSFVFILWGVTEGFVTEAATCSALNFFRILFLLWIALHLNTFQDNHRRLINNLAISLLYGVITVVVYYPVVVDEWYKSNSERKVVVIFLLLMLLIPLLYAFTKEKGFCKKFQNHHYVITEAFNLLRMYFIAITYGRRPENLAVLVFPFLAVICFVFYLKLKNLNYLLWVSVMLILEVLSASGSIYIHYDVQMDVKERDTLVCVTVFLHILTLITLFTQINRSSESRNTGTQRSLSYLVVFMFGTVGVVFVNTVTLVVELILKTRNGERTVDLRLILLPTESFFAACCLALQISTFCQTKELCRCKQTPDNDSALQHEHEMENLAPVPQPPGS
ncbi:hypothetical protein KOW79_011655 [Hemibagrus wyckioides]|uniref:Ig-like domain-containing protein n=2 Tax=Hemibagrus wyckioides TaxID=337641 RepID=A0A9D3SN22_9TELE|nr:hypothetical protein KOW79_011655 [Hemibagrus wyckioides]